MLDAAVQQIRQGNYAVVLTTGVGNGEENPGKICKERLVGKGIDPHMIHAVTGPRARFHRTYRAAIPVRGWLEAHHYHAVNVFSGGTHGRKTYVIYKRVLEKKNIKTGIISCRIRHFDSLHWWTSWHGSLVTLRHLIGYVYALCWPFSLMQP